MVCGSADLRVISNCRCLWSLCTYILLPYNEGVLYSLPRRSYHVVQAIQSRVIFVPEIKNSICIQVSSRVFPSWFGFGEKLPSMATSVCFDSFGLEFKRLGKIIPPKAAESFQITVAKHERQACGLRTVMILGLLFLFMISKTNYRGRSTCISRTSMSKEEI